MTMTQNLRSMLSRTPRAQVRAELDALDAAEKAATEAAAAEAKRAGNLQAKLEAALPERTQALAADWFALQAEAVRLAAEDQARKQLAAELGLTPAKSLLFGGWPAARLTTTMVEHQMRRLIDDAPIAYDKAHRSAAEIRSAGARVITEAHEAASASGADDVDARIVAREAMLAARAGVDGDRAARIAERKAAAGLPGWGGPQDAA